MTKEVGTLAELNVKPGDVVKWNGRKWTVMSGKTHDLTSCEVWASSSVPFYPSHTDWISGSEEGCRIISRASDTPKLWRDMTPEEKGALLLAYHEGKVIEYFSHIDHEWGRISEPDWRYNYAYRLKPEPKVETVTLYGSPIKRIQWGLEQCSIDTHCITFNLIDGEPDCTSIKMEKL